MKRKNLALRMSACMMSALLTVSSVTPAFAAEDITFEDQAADVAEETAAEPAEVQETESQGEEAVQNEEAADVELESEAVDTETTDSEELFADDFSDAADDSAAVFADETAAAQTGFGIANTQLAAGTYQVTVGLKKAEDVTADSMAGSCIAGKGTLVVAEDGSAKLTVPIQAANVMGKTAYAKDWKVYSNGINSETTDAEFTADENGNVNSITIAIPDKAQDGVYVSMYIDLMQSAQDAFVNVDYANAEKEQAAVDTSALEATIAQADALDEMAYTKESWDGNKDAIEAAKAVAKAALEKKESQEAVDAANTALADAMKPLVKAGNLDALRSSIEAAKAVVETDYTVKSVNNMHGYLEAAEKVLEDRGKFLDALLAKSRLDSAVKSLVKCYNSEKLQKLITTAEALKEEDYTSESWKAANIEGAILTAKEAVEARGDKDLIHSATNVLESAMDELVANGIMVGRGSFAKKLAPGTYSLPIELLNGGKSDATNQYTSSNYMKQVSMAAGCFTGPATLVIHEDGTATLTTGVQAISALGMTGAASDWTIYENTQDYLDGIANPTTGARFKARVDESKVQAGKKKPSKISFTIPDLKQNVVATRMYIEVMSVYQDACIGLDWAKVEKISDDTTATSAVEKEYEVKADTLTQLKNMKAGSAVKLDEDITLTEDLTIKGGTLDLNGHTLSQADNLIMIKGDVTIIDSSEAKNGKITREKYSANSSTTTSISVQKGSLTVDGVAIDGQIGNKVADGDSISLRSNPRVSVKLTNCTLTNTVSGSSYVGGNMNVAFVYLDNGVDVEIDHCTADQGVKVGNGSNEQTRITNGELGAIEISGKTAVVENVTTTGRTSVSASEMEVHDSNFGGLSIGGDSDIVLENIKSFNTDTGVRGGALSVDGVGDVTVKDCVFANEKGYAITSLSAPIKIESGYFKGAEDTVYGAYTTPEGKILGDVTEGEYAGYKTVVDGTEPDVAEPVMTIYNADGSVDRKISDDKSDTALTYAKTGQTVKLNKDATIDSLSFYRDCTFDLNGHVLTLESSLTGDGNCTCRIVDSSSEKTGKIAVEQYFYNGNAENAILILDGITCEVPVVQAISTGKLYVTNGTKVIGAALLNPFMGGGSTYVQDSSWVIAEKDLKNDPIDDPLGLIENCTRTSQYTITQTGDRSFTVTVNDLGKAMRAFEALDASAYTKASYTAAKAVYDEIDGSADEDIQGDVIAQKAKELNDAVAALQAPASEKSVAALKSAITAALKLKSTDYTAASFKTFKAAITAATEALDNEDLSETQVTTVTKNLAAAKAKLVKMKAQTITVSVKNSKGVVSKKYGDKAFYLGAKGKGGLTYKSSNTKIATVDSKGKVTIKAAGTVKITVTAKATTTYKSAVKTVTVKVAKAAPSIKTKIGSKTFTYAAVKKKAQAFTLGTSVNSKGKLTFKKLSGTSAIAVSSTGKFTVKKGLKKGTYKVKVKITAAAKGNYNAGSRTVTVTVKVK